MDLFGIRGDVFATKIENISCSECSKKKAASFSRNSRWYIY